MKPVKVSITVGDVEHVLEIEDEVWMVPEFVPDIIARAVKEHLAAALAE